MCQNSKNIFNKDFAFTFPENLDKKIEETKKIYNEERCETKLILRKKNLNKKINHMRKIEFNKNENQKINVDKLIYLNIPFTAYTSKLSEEFYEENKLIDLLNKISYILEQKYRQDNTAKKDLVYQFTKNDLIINNFAEKIYNLILKYLKSDKVMSYLSRILLFSSLFTENNLGLNSDNNSYFISSEKYIDAYNKILEIYINSDCQISYNMIIFIGNILKNSVRNQLSLYSSGTLNYIIDSIDVENDSPNILGEKIWCLSQFKQNKIYEVEAKFSLKIQKVYCEIFFKKEKYSNLFNDINEKADVNNFLFNYLVLIENTTNCIDSIFIENIIKSTILPYLFTNFIDKDITFLYIIIDILINLSQSEYILGHKIINLGSIDFIIKIISNGNFPMDLRISSFIPINNYINDVQLWRLVLYEKKVLQLYYSLLNDNELEPNFFSEICLGFYQLLFYDNKDILKDMLVKNLMKILCKDIKDIINRVKSEKTVCECLSQFCALIIALIKKKDEEKSLIENLFYIFKQYGGEEIIDSILCAYSNVDIEERNEEDKDTIINLLEMAENINSNVKKE